VTEFVVLFFIVMAIAGISQLFVRAFWRACVVSAFGSALVYALLVLVLTPSEAATNEMFGAGIIQVGLYGFLLSMIMGIAIRIFRPARNARADERRGKRE